MLSRHAACRHHESFVQTKTKAGKTIVKQINCRSCGGSEVGDRIVDAMRPPNVETERAVGDNNARYVCLAQQQQQQNSQSSERSPLHPLQRCYDPTTTLFFLCFPLN